MKRSLSAIFCILGLVSLSAASAEASAQMRLVIDNFTDGPGPNGAPSGWESAAFNFSPRRTSYTIEKEDGNWLLKASSASAASAIYKEVSVDPKVYPILTWRWKVSNTLSKGDESTKEGDDYAARLYVSFSYRPGTATALERLKRGVIKSVYGKELPGESIVYVWANRLSRNSHLPNPDTEKAVMFAVESGQEKAGEWRIEGRNVYEDYRRIFGAEPPEIAFIGIMTDTDNTGEEALAWYDDIVFHRNYIGEQQSHGPPTDALP